MVLRVSRVMEQDSPESVRPPRFQVDRDAFSQGDFNSTFEATRATKQTIGEKTAAAVKSRCTARNAKNALKSLFPIIGWLGRYNIKRDLVADIVAGITIAIFQVPQSMAYSMLAGVQPVHGLYTAFFPCILYSIMGTSRHAAIGSFAVVSLMTSAIVSRFATGGEGNLTLHEQDGFNATTTSIPLGPTWSPIEVATAVTLVVGFYQALFGIFQLGMMSAYLSPTLVTGFTAASAVHVGSSQLKYIFDISPKSYNGPFNLIRTYISLIEKIPDTNYVTLLLSVSAMVIIFVVKYGINERFKHKLKIPIPIELIVVVGGTAVSHFLKLGDNHGVRIVGTIPTGLPEPRVPDLTLFPKIAVECISLAIVGFSLTLSVSKIFAQRHGYNIDANQEFIALGVANVCSSFFLCIPSAASLARSSVQEGAGGKTQLVSLVNATGILIVLLALGHLLEELPNCILASIIIVALKTLLSQVLEVRRYWKVSKVDTMIFVVTYLSVIILDVDIGLAVGVIVSLLSLVIRSQRPKTYLLGNVGNTDVYVPLKKYRSAKEIPGIRIFYFGGPLHFANIEYFGSEFTRLTEVNAGRLRASRKKAEAKKEKDAMKNKAVMNGNINGSTFHVMNGIDGVVKDKSSSTMTVQSNGNALVAVEDGIPSHIIVDCCGISFIDTPGAMTLSQVVSEYAAEGINVFLAACPAHMRKMLEKDGLSDPMLLKHIFPTIHDAVLHATRDCLVDKENCTPAVEAVITYM